MKAGVYDGQTHSQRLTSFLLSYQSTPHAATHKTSGELFLKCKLRTRFELIKPDMTKSVCAEQAQQKSNHDHHSQGHEYFVSQNVQVHNFPKGSCWAPGVIVERVGPLTYLVQMDTGVFCQCHIDYLRTTHDRSPDTNKPIPSTSVSSELLTHFDFIPIVESDKSSIVEQRTQQPITDRCYAKRLNCRPLAGYCS